MINNLKYYFLIFTVKYPLFLKLLTLFLIFLLLKIVVNGSFGLLSPGNNINTEVPSQGDNILQDNMQSNDTIINEPVIHQTIPLSNTKTKKEITISTTDYIIIKIIAELINDLISATTIAVCHIIIKIIDFISPEEVIHNTPPVPNNPLLLEYIDPTPTPKSTIFAPSMQGIAIYSNNEIFDINLQLRNSLAIANNNLLMQGIVSPQLEVLHDIFVAHPLYHQLFTLNPDHLRDSNFVINLLIQDAIIQYAFTNDQSYYHIALALMMEQIAYVNHQDVLNYYHDASIMRNMKEQLITAFRL